MPETGITRTFSGEGRLQPPLFEAGLKQINSNLVSVSWTAFPEGSPHFYVQIDHTTVNL